MQDAWCLDWPARCALSRVFLSVPPAEAPRPPIRAEIPGSSSMHRGGGQDPSTRLSQNQARPFPGPTGESISRVVISPVGQAIGDMERHPSERIASAFPRPGRMEAQASELSRIVYSGDRMQNLDPIAHPIKLLIRKRLRIWRSFPCSQPIDEAEERREEKVF
jgi:hypothetical protein